MTQASQPAARRNRRPSALWLGLLTVAAFTTGALLAKYHLLPYGALKWAREFVLGAGEEPQAPPRGGFYRTPDEARGAPGDIPEDLASVPYLQGQIHATEIVSVTGFEEDLAQPGLNLVVSGHGPEAVLLDMKGNEVHSWSKELDEIWPGPLGFREYEPHKKFWRRAHVFPNGDLLAIFEGIGMVKLDSRSNVLWENKGRCHHDLFVAEDGVIYTLSRHLRDKHARFGSQGKILEDFVTILSPNGEELERISILDAFLDSDYAAALAPAHKQGDILHTNTIELMDGRFAERHPLYTAGNALISIPSLNLIAVMSLTERRIVWTLGGLWTFQHQPTVLDDGRMLVFDNQGHHGKSKVVEIDPLTQEIHWAYRHTEAAPFHSQIIGSCQRLPNGNTLITESTKGRAFEVTRGGQIVWEFYNPERAGADQEFIACLYELVRIDSDYFTGTFAEAVRGGIDQPIDTSGVKALIDPGSPDK